MLLTRFAAALALVGLTSTAMGYATYAYFNDTETVDQVEFLAGTLDLSTTDPATVRSSLGATNFAPGDTRSATIDLTNTGSIYDGDAQSHSVVMDWKMSVAEKDASSGATDIAEYIQVTTMTYGGDDYLAAGDGGEAVTDANANGWIDLDDVANAGAFTAKSDPGTAGSAFAFAVKFHETAGNDLQGDEAEISFTFFLRQAGETALA